MANHFFTFDRPLIVDSVQAKLGITGLLPEYVIGSAYAGELDVINSVGRLKVEIVASHLPAGATVRADGIRKKIMVAWPAFKDELPVTKLVPNGGFEDGDNGVWEKQGGWSIEKNDPYNVESGLWSAKFHNIKTKGQSLISLPVPAKVNDRIKFNARIQQGASSKGNAGARCHLWFLDAAGNVLSSPSGPMVSSGSGGEWKNSGGEAAAPANTAYVRVVLAAYRNRQNKPLHVDNVTWDHAFRWGQNEYMDYWVELKLTDGLNRVAYWKGEIISESVFMTSGLYPVLFVDELRTDHGVLDAIDWESVKEGPSSVSSSTVSHGLLDVTLKDATPPYLIEPMHVAHGLLDVVLKEPIRGSALDSASATHGLVEVRLFSPPRGLASDTAQVSHNLLEVTLT